MQNIPILYTYIHAIIFALSIIAFFDVFFKFKRPLILKFFLLAMVFNIGFFGFGQLYIFVYGYNRLLSELPITLLGITAVNFFYQLYRNKLSSFVIISCIFLILVTVSVPLYFQYKYNLSFLYEDFYNNPITSLQIKTIRLIAVIFFLFLGINLLFNIIKKYENDNIYYKALKSWCFSIISVLVITMFLNILHNISPSLSFLKIITNTFLCLFQVLIIIYRPNFLNSIPIKMSILKLFSNRSRQNINTENFASLFFTQSFYLKEKATIHDLAKELNVSSEDLLEYIKLNYDLNFADFVNKNRILYFIDLINMRENQNFTIEALSKKSGFSSRQNMHKSFKRYHGGNPSDLINIMKFNNE